MSRADELRALADAATPGPWAYEQIDRGAAQVGLVWDEDDKPISGVIGPDDGTVIEHVAEVNRGEDARLIALAPSLARDHAALLDERERDRVWMRRAAEWLRSSYGMALEDHPTVRGLLAEWAEMQEPD